MVQFRKRKDGTTYPISDNKSKPHYAGQNKDSSWKKTSIEDVKSKELSKKEMEKRGYVFYPSGAAYTPEDRRRDEEIRAHIAKERKEK